jgi:hypothetical protein
MEHDTHSPGDLGEAFARKAGTIHNALLKETVTPNPPRII